MNHDRQNGVIFSALLHFAWLVFAIFGLPLLISSKPPPEPTAISVELLPITGITNVKPSESQPAPEEKQEKKPEQPKKPTPPVKTADNTPPPPPKADDKAKLPPKPEEKKPEEKKDKKAKAEDLAAVLRAVKDTAQKEKPDADKNKDTSKSKSVSSQYNDSLPMSMSEKDAIRSQFAACWHAPIGAKDAYNLLVVVDLEIAQDGTVLKAELGDASKSKYNSDSFFRAAADSALRATHECSPLKSLPPEKYDTWHYMELTFDPKDMLF